MMGDKKKRWWSGWQLLRDTWRLDVCDLNYILSSAELDIVHLCPQEMLPKRGLVRRLGRFMINCVKTRKEEPPVDIAAAAGKILFYLTTGAHAKSLAPVAKRIENSLMIGPSADPPMYIPLRGRAPIVSLIFWPAYVRELMRMTRFERQTLTCFFDRYWETFGTYYLARKWLRKSRPAALVVANDHCLCERALNLAARDEHIPTFYIQHGAVSKAFPPLAFDYALLDGMAAAEHYNVCGSSETRVFLVGSPGLDPYYSGINCRATAQTLGICTNEMNRSDRLEALCRAIRKEFPDLPVVLRPRPSDPVREQHARNLCRELRFDHSDPESEPTFAFLSRIDVMVACSSSILMEAVLMNVLSVQYQLDDKASDCFGFIASGLVEFIETPEVFCRRWREWAISKPYVRTRSRYYCHTVDTPYDGQSSELAARVIREAILNGQVDMTRWRKVSDSLPSVFVPL